MDPNYCADAVADLFTDNLPNTVPDALANAESNAFADIVADELPDALAHTAPDTDHVPSRQVWLEHALLRLPIRSVPGSGGTVRVQALWPGIIRAHYVSRHISKVGHRC